MYAAALLPGLRCLPSIYFQYANTEVALLRKHATSITIDQIWEAVKAGRMLDSGHLIVLSQVAHSHS